MDLTNISSQNQRVRCYLLVAITLFPIAVLTLLVFIVFFKPIFNNMENIVSVEYNDIRSLHNLQVSILKAAMPPNDYLIYRHNGEIQNWKDIQAIVDKNFQNVINNSHSTEYSVKLLQLKKQWKEAALKGDEIFSEHFRHESSSRLYEIMEDFDTDIDNIGDYLSGFIGHRETLVRSTYLEIENLKTKAIFISVSAIFIGLVLGILSSFWLSKIRRQMIGDTLLDSLTGVYNRRALDRYLGQLKDDQENWENPNFSVLLLDLDNFKKINDQYGHDIGDVALKTFANLASKLIRNSDLLGRYGGEEFLLLLPETGRKEAATLAERIRSHIESASISLPGQAQNLKFTVSIGCATTTNNTYKIDDIVKSADEALYRAKESGRNRVVCVII